MGVIIMLFFLSIMVAATSPITAKFPFNFPRPQVLALPTFPWVPMPFVGGPNSLPPWLRPQVSEDKPGMEEFPIEEQEMIVGGPDSLPPWLRPQTETSENKEEMIVGGPDSLPPWLRPQTETSENEEEGGPDSLPPWLRPPVQGSESVPTSRFIDNTGAAKDTLEEEGNKEDASKEERYGYGYNYNGISPVSSGSFIQPGYYSGYSSPYYAGYSTYPYTGYAGGYAGTGGNAGTGYAGYANTGGYSGYVGYPTNTGYTYYTG